MVVAAQLQFHALVLVEIEEIVALQKLVGELGEAEAVASRTVESLLHAVLRHHIVHGDVLSDLTCEVEERKVLHPVVVVHHFGSVLLLRLEIEEFRHLRLDALLIVAQSLVGEQVTLLRLSRRVANHSRCTAHKDNRLVAAALQVAQHHNAAQVSDVQRVSRRVRAQICCNHLPLQEFFCSRHHLCQHPAPAQFFYEIFSHWFLFLLFKFTNNLILSFLSICYGTGSYPLPPHGLHRRSRQMAR